MTAVAITSYTKLDTEGIYNDTQPQLCQLAHTNNTTTRQAGDTCAVDRPAWIDPTHQTWSYPYMPYTCHSPAAGTPVRRIWQKNNNWCSKKNQYVQPQNKYYQKTDWWSTIFSRPYLVRSRYCYSVASVCLWRYVLGPCTQPLRTMDVYKYSLHTR